MAGLPVFIRPAILVVGMGKDWRQEVLDWFFPRRCGLCARLGDRAVCDECLAAFPSAPSGFDLQRLGGAVDDLVTPYAFEGRASQAVRRLKYERVTSLADPMAEILAKSFEEEGLGYCDLIVPVPVSRQRRFERGFNQSEMLVAALPPDKVVAAALSRVRHTKPQVGLTAAERMKNLVGAFEGEPKLLKGRSVLLVDDVVTTGGTALACGQELKRCGASRVTVLAFCGGRIEDGA